MYDYVIRKIKINQNHNNILIINIQIDWGEWSSLKFHKYK